MNAALGTLNLHHVQREGVPNNVHDGIRFRFMNLPRDLHPNHAQRNLLSGHLSAENHRPYAGSPIKVIQRVPILVLPVISDETRRVPSDILRR
jgi:hypothetical protein